MMSATPVPMNKRVRIYRHCRNCDARLKTGQQVLCPSCRVAGAWGAFLVGALVAAMKVVGVL